MILFRKVMLVSSEKPKLCIEKDYVGKEFVQTFQLYFPNIIEEYNYSIEL